MYSSPKLGEVPVRAVGYITNLQYTPKVYYSEIIHPCQTHLLAGVKWLESESLLIYELVVLGAESRKTDTLAVAPFGYDIENIKFWFLIIFHNRNSI